MKQPGSDLLHHLRVFVSASKAGIAMFYAEYTPTMYFGTAVPRYVLQSAFFVLLARFAGGEELMRYALLGNAIQIAINMGLVNMTSTVESEKWIGTLPLLIAVPSSKLPALVGRGMGSLVEGLTGVSFALIIGMFLFRTFFDPLRILIGVPLILLIVLTILGLGLVIGAVTLPMRTGTLASNAIAYVMMILCGINFPITAMPDWLQIFARLLPVTNGLMALREVVDGARYADVLPLIAMEVAVGAAYYLVGHLVFQARLRAARQHGTIELF